MRITKHFFILLLIIILGLFARLFRIDIIRLTHDEMSIGYNAYSILKTGKDEWGRFMPLDFEAFGDHKLPLYIYSSVPFIFLFGLTELAVKLPSILSGTILIILMYLLTYKLSNNKHLSLLSALLVAFSPVTIHLSRSALETNLALSLFTGGVLLTTYYLKNKKEKLNTAIFAGVLFGLTFYTYVAYRLLILLFFNSCQSLHFGFDSSCLIVHFVFFFVF